ncbi:MAG TPA: phosphonoacetaldehyde hydrolase [Aggregatilineales bacterium]|nr:phosphonoacetaldehyde hydrolase [Aggregatilineales bacterium]
MASTAPTPYRFRRTYSGPLQGVILDWSGTTVDYGCIAPAKVFVDIFTRQGVPISMEEARGPMGMYKRDHIRQITQMPSIAARWQDKQGRLPTEDDVQAMYDAFIPLQIACIAEYADPIPGVPETVKAFHQRGLKVGSTTGYTRAMMDVLLPEASKRGYAPDCLVCPDEVAGGRPAPWMSFQNAMRLGIYPMESFVKIGDTVVDIAEGLNAGMWTIALAKTGNELGLMQRQVESLTPESLSGKLKGIYERLNQAGAHYVVDSLADVLPILDHINERLAQGEKP